MAFALSVVEPPRPVNAELHSIPHFGYSAVQLWCSSQCSPVQPPAQHLADPLCFASTLFFARVVTILHYCRCHRIHFACFRLLRQLLLLASASASSHFRPSTTCSCILLPAALSPSFNHLAAPRLAPRRIASASHRTTSLDRYRRCRRHAAARTAAPLHPPSTNSIRSGKRFSNRFLARHPPRGHRFSCSLPFHARLATNSASSTLQPHSRLPASSCIRLAQSLPFSHPGFSRIGAVGWNRPIHSVAVVHQLAPAIAKHRNVVAYDHQLVSWPSASFQPRTRTHTPQHRARLSSANTDTSANLHQAVRVHNHSARNGRPYTQCMDSLRPPEGRHRLVHSPHR